MTEDELRAIEARTGAACDMVAALCRPKNMPGAREWVMSIPARRSHDPDLIINAALVDIPRLAAALREAWEKKAEYWYRADRAEKDAAEYAERLYAAEHPPCPVCGNEERHSGTGALTCECPDPSVTRALAAEAAAAATREALLAERDAAQAEVKRLRDEQAERVRVIEGLEFRERDMLAERDRLREAGAHVISAAERVDMFKTPQSVCEALQGLRAALKEETSNG